MWPRGHLQSWPVLSWSGDSKLFENEIAENQEIFQVLKLLTHDLHKRKNGYENKLIGVTTT